MLVAANKELYVTLPKRQKMLLSQSVVNAVRSQNPPGRFLQKDPKTDLWYDVGDKRAQEKTSQALREGAPEIRQKLTVNKGPEKNATVKTESSDELSSNDGEEDGRLKVDSGAANSKPLAQILTPATTSSTAPNSQESGRTEKYGVAYPPLVPSSNDSPIGIPPPVGPPSMMAPPVLPPPIPPQGPVPSRARGKKGHQQQQQQQQQYSSNENGVRGSIKDQPYAEHQRQVHFPEDQMHQQFQFFPPNSQQQQPYANGGGCPDALPPPPPGMEAQGGCSFGSLGMMSIGEHDRLMLEKFDEEPIPMNTASGAGRFNGIANNLNQQYERDIPHPVDGGLEPIGLSFGSMMSVGTDLGMTAGKLESAGLSFGSWSAMSYSVMGGSRHAVAPPDGGLQDIGTSFGSLSLAEGERERIIALAERDKMLSTQPPDGEAADVPPTFLQQQKSTGNLLDCSDTESEDEDTSAEASAQKSAQWEKLQAALAEQDESIRNSRLTAAMPPTAFGFRNNNRQQPSYPAVGSTFQIPHTALDRDFSQMSAISVQEDFEPVSAVSYQSYVLPTPAAVQQVVYDSQMPPPPAAIKKGRSDDWSTGNLDDEDEDVKLEYTFLNRGNSLASEQF